MNKRKIVIGNEEYYLITDYKDTEKYRRSLNRLTQKTFGFDFEDWYRQGYWNGDKYRPYSLFHEEEIAANVSCNPIDYLIDGELHHTLQIGTVMTDNAYRHKGLSRILMQAIFSDYENICEMIYLYGNDSVLDFYPKFGFTKAEEYIYTKIFYAPNIKQVQDCGHQNNKLTFRKLHIHDQKDMAILTRLVKDTLPVSGISMVGNQGLKMFYLTSGLAENIYYNEEAELAAAVSFEEGKLELIDVFCGKAFNLDRVILSLINQPEMEVSLGFTPKDTSSFISRTLKVEDSTFFVKGKNLIGKGRFPVLSHA